MIILILTFLLHLCFIWGAYIRNIWCMKKILLGIISVLMMGLAFGGRVAAADCRDIEFVYARGSGAARNATAE